MTNIASNETASFDVVGQWTDPEHCHITFTLNEDGLGECAIDYRFDQFDLVFLRDIINEFLDSQPLD